MWVVFPHSPSPHLCFSKLLSPYLPNLNEARSFAADIKFLWYLVTDDESWDSIY
ncbi:MAG: hypothetical protein ACI8UG_002397 [Gammaproteobacteria bacterium]|jgi:hypothetical protein